ncbi:hypothetical protein D9Q98_000962 [Chlorella vulgaris]|uniref:Uncharacterized protein n=1 Tax=Chlorella vulgaris TaxID=3077 RepID=A0A9D4Z249_CHLVU|nr:hypothetical protein D9Q98_000962 [Chlorella vulgaris]
MPVPILAVAAQPASISRVAVVSKSSLRSTTAVCRAKQSRGRGGGSGSGGGQSKQKESVEEDVEIFNIDTGWNVDALEDVAYLLDDEADLEGWSVEGGDDDLDFDGGAGDEGWSVTADGDSKSAWIDLNEEEDGGEAGDADAELLAAFGPSSSSSSSSSSSKARPGRGAPASFGGRVLGKAEEQVMASLPRHLLRRLEGQQREADEERARLRPEAQRKAAARLKTHQQLRIISGTAAGRRLRSPQGDQTRPMMELVRNAVFSMVMSLYGCSSTLPEKTRWLDLYAGTGAVGIEALSRGVGQCHFVEMSPWVVGNCLMPNLETCDVEGAAVVHTGKAEDFLRRAQQLSRFAGGAFDFMSVCPPYELVDYEEIFDLLHDSPLLHEESIVIVEYPKKLASLIRDKLGPLEKLRDRRYGRTYMAIYGPPLVEA